MSRHFDASSPSSSSPTTAGKQPTPTSASSQQQLEGNTLFEHLGEPMKRLLLQVHRDISDNDLTMYSKISVRQMAKVFDMLSLEEDPDKILAWLHREASRDQQQGNRRDPGATGGRRGDGIRQSTVAADPIKLYRELEQKHVLLMEKFRQDQIDRDHARSLNAAERKQRREAQGLIPTSNDNQENIAAATSSSVAGTISDVLSKTELADVVGSFERFTAQQSTYDNSSSHQDNEWWKKDEYRRNWEKFGTKGKLWTRVLEGGTQEAPESERLVRDEWYKSQTWWKGDTYRRDWNASRGTEWWKEEPYLVDWQDHGDKGSMWMANDEATGFKKKGHRRPASNVERARRVAWYQINGPRGIVKMWCACSEGSMDRCTLEEKREREDYYKHGDWWRSADNTAIVAAAKENPARCSALRFAGPAAADRDWWKLDVYRFDFENGGTRWRARHEKAAVTQSGESAPPAVIARREEWYRENWWKCDKYRQDFVINGPSGKLWTLATATPTTGGGGVAGKLCTTLEMRQREEWFKSAGDQEWWKEEPYMRDWQEHQGSRRREDAKKWTAAYEHAAEDASATAATEEELDKREAYYRDNWWKREKYLADFIANKECGAIWQTKTGAALADGEWWKADRFKKEYQSLKQTSGEAFWKSPDCIDDYFSSGSSSSSGKPQHFSGKKWTAATPASSSVGLGDEVRASDADLVERVAYYQSHWWKQTQFSRDYAVNGKRRGNKWSEGATGGPDQLRERAEYFDPQWRKKVRPGYRAMLAIDADHVPHSISAVVPLPERNERAQYYEESWWRRFGTLEEYAALGASARSLHAATVETAYFCSATTTTTTTQHTTTSSSKETARRLRAIDRGLVDDVWLHNDFFIDLKNSSPFWQSPECVEDFYAHGDHGQLWTRSNSTTSAAQDAPLTAAEKSVRVVFYKFHFWRTLRCQRDFDENGANGTLWTATEPKGKGTRASDAELRLRAQTFRMSSSVSAAQAELRQTLFHSHSTDGEKEELHNQQEHYLESLESFSQLSEEHFHRLYSLPLTKAEQTEAYVQRFWWRAPEVRADYEACARAGGGSGKLYRAATAAVAASGLGDRPSYQASIEHIASREKYFKSLSSSQVNVEREILPQSLFSQQLEAARNLGTLFWVTSAYIADYVNHRESGKKWTAADAAAGSTSQGDTHRAPDDELNRRRMFYERMFWKAPQYALDFAQHGPAGQLWKAASLEDSTAVAPPEELELRLACFTEPIREAKRRAEHFCKYFWRTPEAIADYELHGMKSRFILAATPAAVHDPLLTAAAAAQSQRSLQATPDEVEVRVQYFENRNAHGTHTTPGARSSKESDLEDNSVVAQIAPMDDSWWRSETYAREYFWSQEPEFWKRPAMIEDYYNSLAAAGGTKQQWAAKNIAMLTLLSSSTSSPSATGGDWWGLASKAELEFREAFMKLNFWRAPKFQHDHHLHGLKGTLWTNSDASGRGQPVSRFEMNARSHLAYRCTKFWEQQHASSSPDYGRVTSCTLTEALDREEWYEQNWWKCDDIKQDVLLRGGDNSVLVRAATYEAYLSGEYRTDARYQASQSDIAARVAYFTATQSSAALDQEWWKCSNVITDFVNYGEEGVMWKSQTQRHARESIGAEIPALEHELHSRREWYRRYFWRSSEAIQQYCTSTASNQGSAAGKASGSQILWKAASLGGIGDAPPAELKERERWLQENRPVDSSEVTQRKEWYERQLSDEEKQSRRVWLLARAGAAKKIFRDELAECLRQLNDGAVPTTEQIRAIEAAVLASRAELAEDGGGADDIGTLDGISQEEFVAAVALTKFYLAATPEERQRAEAEALEALHREEMARAEEEIGYLALEAEEELTAAGLEYVEEAELTAEESNFLEQMEEEEELRNTKSGIHANEDAMPVAAEAEAAYHEFYANNNNDDHEYAVNDDDEDDGAAEALIVAVATTEDNDESSPFSAETLQDLQQTLQDDNDEQQHQEESTESQHEDQQQEDEPEEPLRISLKSATNPQFFKAHFSCIQLIHSSKRTFSSSPSKEKRVWVIDHFTRSIYSYDKQSDGKIKEQYAANALMQMVRSLVDSTLIHLLFLTGGSSGSGSGAGDGKVDLIFYNTEERQRFYETTYAIRPAIRVYAPDLVHPDHHQQRSALSTVIDAVGANSMRSLCFDQFGKQAMRELSGECSVNASPTMTECLTVWCGTLNLEGRRPTALKGSMEAALEEWMPRGSFDVYAVCVQEASFCGSDDKTPWIECVQQHLGKSYIALGHAYLWNTVLVVMIRMKHLLKVGSIDKSTAPTKHQKVCGAKGGVALSFHFMETSMCFVGCHLAARKEWVDMRNQNLADMFESLTLESNRSNDVYSQFDHLFLLGDFNYRSTLDIATTSELVAAERYTELLSFDQLTQQREVAGILYGVTEAPITFPPTFMSGGGGGASGDNAPSYCARIMSKSISPMVSSMLNCTRYYASPSIVVPSALPSSVVNDITASSLLHQAVAATFVMRCIRPVMSCFTAPQQPIPEFAFFNIGLRRIHRPNNTLASSKNGVAINKNEIIKRPQLLFRTTFTQTYTPVPCKSTTPCRCVTSSRLP